MPEVLKFENMPKALVDYHIEPFREEYIPGSRVLSREWSSKGFDIFFQIPTPIMQKMDDHEVTALKRQICDWWQDTRRTD